MALVSIVMFSLSIPAATSGEGICAIDFRERGRFCCATAVSPCAGGIVIELSVYAVVSVVTYIRDEIVMGGCAPMLVNNGLISKAPTVSIQAEFFPRTCHENWNNLS